VKKKHFYDEYDMDREEMLYEGDDLYEDEDEYNEEDEDLYDDYVLDDDEEDENSEEDKLNEEIDDSDDESSMEENEEEEADEVDMDNIEELDEDAKEFVEEIGKEMQMGENEQMFDRYYNDTTLTEFEREDLLNEIAKKNIKTIYYIVNKNRNFQGMVSMDELTNAGFVGYAKAIKKYDPSRDVKFSTFAINCIKNEISFCLRTERKHYERNISTNYVKHQDKNGNDLKIEDTLKDESMTPEEQVRHQALRKLILENLDLLSPVEKYVVVYRFGLDRSIVLTQKQIASLVDMSQANISKIERNCIEKLRDLLNTYLF